MQRGIDITRKQQRPGPVPVVSSGGIKSFHDTFHRPGPGVVLGRKGSLGTVFFLPGPYWPHDTTLWVREFKGNNPKFVYYFFKNLDVMHLDVGSANPTLNRNHVHPIEVVWPPLPEQRRIAAVLGALDDKIELNRKMNRTLEEMAQALFKSWFIDFDDHDDLVSSELGPIPAGWEVGRLGDVLELKRGYDLPKKRRKVGDVPIISSSGPTGWHDEAKVMGPVVVTGRYGTIGQVFFINRDAWPLNTSLYVRDFKGYPPRFAFHLLERVHWSAYLGKSAVPGVNRNHVHMERIARPPVGFAQEFSEVVEHFWAKHEANKSENTTLADLRDTLLPKLISGEIRIPEAEKTIEEVA
ncbi:restriction endonuclease subunit S [Acidimicrobium ferrooxidans]|nr:restriction endonuclease subunit S [Acidimicrobium ferrooxidans]